MATVLRRSATTLNIVVKDEVNNKNVLFLNRKMAAEIESAAVDESITLILVDIIQYNKETGWGKARLAEVASPVSFNVPSDIKGKMQPQLVEGLNKEKVYIQAYFVRDKANIPTRLIVVGILSTPKE